MRIAWGLIVAVLVVGLAAVVLAVIGPFQDDDEQPAAAELSVDAIVATPPRWYREAVEVTARAVPLGDERFLLEGDEHALVVQPQPDAVEGEVERGERVTVGGTVYRLNRLQVSALRPLRQDDPQPLLAAAPALGDPYISAEYVDASG